MPSQSKLLGDLISAAGAIAVSGSNITANTVANSAFQTGSVENYFNAQGLSIGRNRIINGAMVIDQRNAGASQTFTAAAAVAYTVDRWYGSCTGANITGQRVAGTSPNQYAYKFTGAASNTGTLFGQRIESYNCYDLISTTVIGSVTLSSSSITTVTWTAYHANSSDTFSSKTSIATGTLTITSTPTRYSFSFNAGANAGNGIALEFTTGALTASNTLQYENAQLEIGSTATPFERRMFGQELALCQRYYTKSYNTDVAPNTSTPVGCYGGIAYSSSALGLSITTSVTLRTSPSVQIISQTGTNGSVTSTGGGNVGSGFVADQASMHGSLAVLNGSGMTAGSFYYCHWTVNAEL